MWYVGLGGVLFRLVPCRVENGTVGVKKRCGRNGFQFELMGITTPTDGSKAVVTGVLM